MFEYDYFDGDHFITFDIIDVDEENNTVIVAISNQGRITQDTFDLLYDYEYDEQYNDNRYFDLAYMQIKYRSAHLKFYKEIDE